jgi:cell division protein FtsI (penicillin-binding protein 3)
VILTLDSQLQYIAERELDKAYRKYRPRRASLVLLDPFTGEILALANRPAFNCNRAALATEFERRNTANTDTFEPGSTFKVVTAALALENGVVTPQTLVDCKYGKARILGRVVRDHEGTLGVVPFEDVIAQSSNIGAVTVALKVGKQKFYEGARRFGFGERTGVDLPGEAPGLLRPPEQWSHVSMAALPYGQELSCNLLHVACLYAPFANGGRTVVPHVVKEVRPCSGWSHTPRLSRRGGDRVVGSRVRRQIKEMLEAAVERGTGTPAQLPGFQVAGKTGTSEKYDPRRKAYAFDKNCSSFVGFVPADNPRFLMAVLLDEPHGLTLGGWVAGPVFREVASAALAAWKVAPDRQPDRPAQAKKENPKSGAALPGAMVQVPDLKGLDPGQAKKRLKNLGLKPRPKGGQGNVVSQFPEAGRSVRQATFVSYLLAKGRGTGRRASKGVQMARGE